MADIANAPQDAQHQFDDNVSVADSRTDDQKQQDEELAERLSSIIEDANSKVVPICKMIRKVCRLFVLSWCSPLTISILPAHRSYGGSEG